MQYKNQTGLTKFLTDDKYNYNICIRKLVVTNCTTQKRIITLKIINMKY